MQAADTKTQTSYEEFCKNLKQELPRVLMQSGFQYADFAFKMEKQYEKDVLIVRLKQPEYTLKLDMDILYKESTKHVSPEIPTPEFEAAFEITQNLLAFRKHAEAEARASWQESAKPKLFYRAISADRCNLENRPHKRLHDLAFVLVQETMKGRLVQVTHDVCEVLGLDEEEAFRIADENTLKENFRCSTFASAFRDMLPEELPLDEVPDYFSDSMPMFILRTDTGMFGASALLFDDVMQQAYGKLGENFYILPSSINELILLPETFADGDLAPFQQMVREVNSNKSLVSDEEHLSDNIYYYDGENRTIALADAAPKLSR